MQLMQQAGLPYLVTASGNVIVGKGVIVGFFCTTSSSGTAAIYDDASTGTTLKIVDTVSLTAGTFYPLSILVTQGVNIVVGGTLKGTLVFAPAMGI